MHEQTPSVSIFHEMYQVKACGAQIKEKTVIIIFRSFCLLFQKKGQLATIGGVFVDTLRGFFDIKRTIRTKGLGRLGFHVNLAGSLRTKNNPLKERVVYY